MVLTGNTTSETSIGTGFQLSVTGTILLDGFSLATLTNSQLENYFPPSVSPPLPNGEMYVSSDGGGVFLSGPGSTPWNGTSSLGPIAFSPFDAGGTTSWETNLGDVAFTSVSSNTFGDEGVLAVTVAEPSTFVMLIIGLAGLLEFRRHGALASKAPVFAFLKTFCNGSQWTVSGTRDAHPFGRPRG